MQKSRTRTNTGNSILLVTAYNLLLRRHVDKELRFHVPMCTNELPSKLYCTAVHYRKSILVAVNLHAHYQGF
jgi:hypothetical protein